MMINTKDLPTLTEECTDKFAHNLAELIFEMQDKGYECKAPSAEAYRIDQEVSTEYTCDRCGGQLFYQPFTKPGGYRAFTVCEQCGDVQEF